MWSNRLDPSNSRSSVTLNNSVPEVTTFFDSVSQTFPYDLKQTCLQFLEMIQMVIRKLSNLYKLPFQSKLPCDRSRNNLTFLVMAMSISQNSKKILL